MKFTIQLNSILQTALVVLQAANAYSAPFPKAQVFVALGLGIVQASTAFLSHYTNPNGTPAALPYVPAA